MLRSRCNPWQSNCLLSPKDIIQMGCQKTITHWTFRQVTNSLAISRQSSRKIGFWKWDLRQDVPEFPCLDLRHFTGPGKDIPLWYPPWNYLGIPLSKWVRNISYPSSVWNIPSCIWLINHLLSEMHFTNSLWWFRMENGPSIDELWWIYRDLPWFTH